MLSGWHAARCYASQPNVNHYRVLRCRRNAGKKELKRAFLRLAGLYHPDRNQGDANAHKRFLRIRLAYEACMQQLDNRLKAPLAPSSERSEKGEDLAKELRPYKRKLTVLKEEGTRVDDVWTLLERMRSDRNVVFLDEDIVSLLTLAALEVTERSRKETSQEGAINSLTTLTPPAYLQMLHAITDSGLASEADILSAYHVLFLRFGTCCNGTFDSGQFIATLDALESSSIRPSERTWELLQQAYGFRSAELNARICKWFESQRLADESSKSRQRSWSWTSSWCSMQ
eukprot:TRINITY_DN53273_c0_g1_i1.p1 TRINITY_DN53273_c0_g1~~TRINITY_DN53273_c0_g1_i1.p1  ORF type:complete len:286 (-),score=27.81 TRINITY_DN53273_c0_g1_i1:21-878(-)